MKEIQFDEEQLKNIQALGQSLFDESPSDPRSWNYKRVLNRPKIRWWRISLFALSVLCSTIVLYFLLRAVALPFVYALLLCTLFFVGVLLLHLKRILICFVQMYQRFAPDSVRSKCRFEPSCSQYMILSLRKYGLWTGLAKGIDRLKRCNTSGGGFDYP